MNIEFINATTITQLSDAMRHVRLYGFSIKADGEGGWKTDATPELLDKLCHERGMDWVEVQYTDAPDADDPGYYHWLKTGELTRY